MTYMIQKLSTLWVLFLLAACVSGSPQNNNNKNITRLVVFGDSNADTGTLARVLKQPNSSAFGWGGRNSNGPVAVEYLAKGLNLPLLNYAIGGATIGVENIVSSFAPETIIVENTGVAAQLKKFQASHQKFTDHDLLIIWAGSNDIFAVKRQRKAELASKIASALDNLTQVINDAQALGATNIIVVNRTARGPFGNDDDLNGQDLNAALAKFMNGYAREKNLQLSLYDAHSAVIDMMKYPARYGFEQVTALCVENPVCKQERYEDGIEVGNFYISWDYPHKTTRVHSLLADQLIELISQSYLSR